ncbi:SWI/SNF-related matrix-associated actin-dependent regulator of chromatin subfamily A member 5-like isoform X2 [Toxorhynchites rutilus septentrionalis]|uniref:SWI/SNF-related matrix-associated actin-dependent regulator of chromatin subfamily A member 5-like isoform X2 n=1 Tax=Toxorhynchites rutilus septentrionalis TaxID=329112 RepID=UPI00247A51A3|nr:SWI/SNF-related matrix-associated actin-dependent regulator of chromatin subfamily A member 5-like isoform X2 [Toxorhynchites rutilus septentrionalis]
MSNSSPAAFRVSQHSPTPSDVLEQSNASDGSSSITEYSEEISRVRLRRLEFIEQKLSQFKSFTQQRMLDREAGLPRGKQKNAHKSTTPKGRKRQQKVQLKNDEVIQFTDSPSFIRGTMRDYQVDGLNWLISLYENGMNGILADEMGLGKTVQAISMLGFLKHYKDIKGPHLIIVPLSTIGNWCRELKRFAPDIKVLQGHCYRNEKKQMHEVLAATRRSWDVVVTSYQFFVSEGGYFRKQNYHYVVVDEAQRCKNEKTLLAKALRSTTYRSILFLSGTPINNNLHELWALLNVLLPEIFREADDFDSWFKVEDCIDPNNERALRLKNILKPIMLRRIKADVELTIPPKITTTIFMPQTKEMMLWSKKVLTKDVQIVKGNGSMAHFSMCNLYPYLREVTLHPYLMPGAEPEPHQMGQHLVNASSRMIVLDKLLHKLKKRGSRVLIFSQFSMLLNILEDYLVWRGYNYCRLSGYTRQDERQASLDEFNAPGSDKFIFMLTTRAGGVGINLPTADTVIFFDIDANPQQDFQAEDRAHRIGQLKQVHVFRFIVLGTVDEHLYEYSMRKIALDAAIIKKSAGHFDVNAAIKLHRERLEGNNSLHIESVDQQLDDIFNEVDNGGRTVANGSIFKKVYLKSRSKRSRSEERILEGVPIKQEDIVEEDMNSSGYVYRSRSAKKPKRE